MEDRESGRVSADLGHTANNDAIKDGTAPSTDVTGVNECSPEQVSGDGLVRPLATGDEAACLDRSGAYRSRYRYRSGLIDTKKDGCYNVRQRIVLREEVESGKVPYPSELIPHAAHPYVQAAIAADPDLLQRLQLSALEWFNWFTSHLEHHFVNPVLLDLKDDVFGLSFPNLMRLDASTIHWEESGHSHAADELSYEIGKAAGESSGPLPQPEFYGRISRIEECVPNELRRLVRLLFVVGTETSITGVLSKLPKCEGVVTAVRDVIRDHSVDEARHSSYFTDVFEYVFPILPSWVRRAIGPLLPEIVYAFLSPDRRSVRHRLTSLGFRPDEVERIIQESYPEAGIRAAVVDSAASALALFRRNGVFKDPETLDAFHRSGLLEGTRGA